jgi:hypothetical protein
MPGAERRRRDVLPDGDDRSDAPDTVTRQAVTFGSHESKWFVGQEFSWVSNWEEVNR